jgi:hypothetical protein
MGAIYVLLFKWKRGFNPVIWLPNNKTGSIIWSRKMEEDEEGRRSCANFRKENV